MATATATFSVNTASLTAVDNTQKIQHVYGTVSFSAATDTYATGGVVASFASSAEIIKSDQPPVWVRIWSQPAVGSPNTFIYLYTFNPGSTLANGKLQVWLGVGASSPEYGNGSALTNPGADTILYEAAFIRAL